MSDIVSEEELTIKRGARAFQALLENDPLLRAQTARRIVAMAKLREGMRAMLDHYELTHEERDQPAHSSIEEDQRIEARDSLVAEIGELSENMYWVLSEALELMVDDNRTWKSEAE